MPLTVRNMEKTNVVFSARDKNGDSVEWKPFGDPDGGDVQQVPESLAQGVNFMRAVGLGILRVEDGDEVLREAIEKQAARYKRDSSASRSRIDDLIIENASSNQIVISEDEINSHIEALSKSQPSDLSSLDADERMGAQS